MSSRVVLMVEGDMQMTPERANSDRAEALPDAGRSVDDLWQTLNDFHSPDDEQLIAQLIRDATLPTEVTAAINVRARDLVAAVRGGRRNRGGIDAFMQEYDLSSAEGVALMCLAEALLRIPDEATIDRLIEDKLPDGDWRLHLGHSDSWLVNASTFGLMIGGHLLRDESQAEQLESAWHKLIKRVGEPVLRAAIRQAMRILAHQFVFGRTIDDALVRSGAQEFGDTCCSFDMLGEAARTAADAARYHAAYLSAIKAVGAVQQGRGPELEHSISVKLSALHPRFEARQRERVLPELGERLLQLALAAKAAGIGLTVDAEECARLELTLALFERVYADPSCTGWSGFGLAVQAYQKRALVVIELLAAMAGRVGRRIPLRLVKGAYWDSEIKLAQQQGLDDYSVYTRKAMTDVAYLACARRMLMHADCFHAQFATHNANTVAAIATLWRGRNDFEFQRLHGMGESLYRHLNAGEDACVVRVYAPVGGHEVLLSYLVRRLLENGANSSFVNRLVDDQVPLDALIVDPVVQLEGLDTMCSPAIPRPRNLYAPQRLNSQGLDFGARAQVTALLHAQGAFATQQWRSQPLVAQIDCVNGSVHSIHNPAHPDEIVGEVVVANEEVVETALQSATSAAAAWNNTGVAGRAQALEQAADLLEANRDELVALCVREAGKTLTDALGEVREAADFCRYYAGIAREQFAQPLSLNGPTGEINELQLHGRGVFACISPWNFPLAIFVGQVAAALVAGNAVIAKPAGPTPLIAARAVALLREAGVPESVLQMLPGDGALIGAALVGDARINGVVFTGSVASAQTINRTLAARSGAIVPLIAETGGLNAMIVDSSALLEQTVDDILISAFGSAGQRCSALRVLCVQEEVAEKLIEVLCGAMAEIEVGDPARLGTDVGPVINAAAQRKLWLHRARMCEEAQLLYEVPLANELAESGGHYFAPCLFEITALGQLTEEVFGPILHLLRYRADQLDGLIAEINATGYGLTVGIQSRMERRARELQRRLRVGNCYVNRNMVGATVGVQPFGGEGLSGTGPKAGGPHYLLRFASERTFTINTTAAGGNAALLNQQSD
jgi:RHH-type proline utilization regulon transcriptional repressor/proline dehydrogenase/delta 1-pyrroline-5-carboxylate dehydrogenase